jgi:hypothetical protein
MSENRQVHAGCYFEQSKNSTYCQILAMTFVFVKTLVTFMINFLKD